MKRPEASASRLTQTPSRSNDPAICARASAGSWPAAWPSARPSFAQADERPPLWAVASTLCARLNPRRQLERASSQGGRAGADAVSLARSASLGHLSTLRVLISAHRPDRQAAAPPRLKATHSGQHLLQSAAGAWSPEAQPRGSF